jgi:methylated-DNA-[protein]-cysteine S-methyltransferase
MDPAHGVCDSTVVDTPVGRLRMDAQGGCLVRLGFGAPAGMPDDGTDVVLREAKAQLQAYFAGRLRDFDLPLALAGTEFQRRVWDCLCEIPYGETISYTELARRVGSPRAVRAVGQANGSNPVAIIVPCHRVIAADGTLGGYAGGLPQKRWLLALERAQQALNI